jgi:hypothetical protein
VSYAKSCDLPNTYIFRAEAKAKKKEEKDELKRLRTMKKLQRRTSRLAAKGPAPKGPAPAPGDAANPPIARRLRSRKKKVKHEHNMPTTWPDKGDSSHLEFAEKLMKVVFDAMLCATILTGYPLTPCEQMDEFKHVAVKASSVAGYGVFAKKFLPKDSKVMDYNGLFFNGQPPSWEFRSHTHTVMVSNSNAYTLCVCRACEVTAAWEQNAASVYCAGIGPCGFLNDAMGPNKGKDDGTNNNNCKLYFASDVPWSLLVFCSGCTSLASL